MYGMRRCSLLVMLVMMATIAVLSNHHLMFVPSFPSSTIICQTPTFYKSSGHRDDDDDDVIGVGGCGDNCGVCGNCVGFLAAPFVRTFLKSSGHGSKYPATTTVHISHH